MMRPHTLALLAALAAGCWPHPDKDDTGGTDAETTSTTGAPDSTAADASTGTSTTGADDTTTTTDADTTTSTSTSTTGTTTTTTTGQDTTGDGTTGAPLCADNDKYELNDAPEIPAEVPWDEVTQYASYLTIDGFLCSGESDWYRVDVGSLDYRVYVLHLDGIVEGSSWCGEGCEEPFLPDAPENTIQIDVHDAETLELLGSQTATDGRVDIGGIGEAYSKDLLVHVHAEPSEATYAYMLSIEIRGYEGEDECEC